MLNGVKNDKLNHESFVVGNGKDLLRCRRRSSMFPRMSHAARVVLCTCPDEASAAGIARAIVESRLAACANLVPGLTSIYRWQDRVETSGESLLIIKTTEAAYPSLEKRIRELHPYEVPEILALDVAAGLPAYLEWVDSCATP